MSSYAHFGTPTCKQAAMQTYRVCKIAEDWRQQQSSALVKRQQQRSTTSVVSSLTYCIYASTLRHQNCKLNTFVSWLAYKWACQNDCLLFIIIFMFARIHQEEKLT